MNINMYIPASVQYISIIHYYNTKNNKNKKKYINIYKIFIIFDIHYK